MLARASALFVLLCALQAAAVELPRADERWWEVRADDIRIFSNASPEAAQALARDVLRMRAAMTSRCHAICHSERREGPVRVAPAARRPSPQVPPSRSG